MPSEDSWRLKVDENLPLAVVAVLRAAGHDVETVEEEGLVGKPDEVVLECCLEEERILVTLDRGFGRRVALDLRTRTAALVVFRPNLQDIGSLQEMARSLVAHLRSRDPRGSLWILHEDRLRIRWLAPADEE